MIKTQQKINNTTIFAQGEFGAPILSNRYKETVMIRRRLLLLAAAVCLLAAPLAAIAAPAEKAPAASVQVTYRTANIDGVEVFYREAGLKDAPVLLLLHGFPTSSHMFRNLIPQLADKYHVIAPDYPGFGQSGMPDRSKFAYTFDNYAQVVDNGNAYNEGIEQFWDPIKAYWRTGGSTEREALRWQTSIKATKWQYTNGVKDVSLVSPDTWTVDQALLDRPGNSDIQLDLFYDYRTNIPLYPQWQAYFREHNLPTLVVWGKNDEIFVAAGAMPYQRDLPNAQVHLLDTGHFALETHGSEIAKLIREFLDRTLKAGD